MRHKRNIHSHSDDEGEIDLTPLIDVVFVVLIIFIIIAPMLEIDRLELASGGSSEDKKLVSYQQKSPLTIQVKGNNTVWIGKRCVRLQDLDEELKKIRAQNPNITPQLFQDKNAYFGTYQSVKNALEAAGYSEVDLVLQPGK